MTFINEFIRNASEEDRKKYRIEDSIQRYGHMNSCDWTIDREKDLYFREIYSGREPETLQIGGYLFFWKGHFMVLEMKAEGGGSRGGDGWSHWTLLDIRDARRSFFGKRISSELQEKLPEILEDIKETLIAYKDSGVFSSIKNHTATFDFSKFEATKQ